MEKFFGPKGFTRVDLVMMIVIIGMMVGGVIKGQAMINDAKQKRLVNDIEAVSLAYYIYYERYNAVPGDDHDTRSWSGISAGNGNGLITGNPTAPEGESQNVWQGLRYAGLLKGDPRIKGRSSLPNNPMVGKYGFSSRDFGTGLGTRNYILIDDVYGFAAEVIDRRFDDGIHDSGSVQADRSYTEGTVDLHYAL